MHQTVIEIKMNKPVLPIHKIFGYGILVCVVGIVIGFIAFLLFSFVGLFTGSKYSLSSFSKISGIIGFLIPTTNILYKYLNQKKEYNNHNKREKLNLVFGLSEEFMSKLGNISMKINSDNESIQNQGMNEYRNLAKKIIEKHKNGESTGVAPKVMKKLHSDFPEFS